MAKHLGNGAGVFVELMQSFDATRRDSDGRWQDEPLHDNHVSTDIIIIIITLKHLSKQGYKVINKSMVKNK